MEEAEPSPDPPRLMFTPLMISLIGIVSTALGILLYNFILTRYCAGRQRTLMPRHIQDCEKESGVEDKVLESIPVLAYKTVQGRGLLRVDHTECVVCLGEFEEGEVIRLLPNCRHAFHVQCIDEWFFSHSSCPVCRSPLRPQAFNLSSQLHSNTVQQDCLDLAEIGSNDNTVLRHCATVVVRADEASYVPVNLKRSLSVDCTYVAVKVQRGIERDSCSSSSSSASNAMLLLRNESESSKRYDRVMKSFSRSRTSQCECDAVHAVRPS